MKLKSGNTYLLNIAPGWFVRARIVDVHESSDGTGGHYDVDNYAYCDFAADDFTKALALDKKTGKPVGVEKVNGANIFKVPDEVRTGIVDALVLQWFLLE